MLPARSLSRTLRWAAAGAALAVAACSGGGTSSAPATPGSAPSAMPTATATATPAASTAQQRATAASALSAVAASIDFDQFGSAGSAALFALAQARKVEARGLPQSSSTTACQHGVEYSYASAASGQFTATIEYFYDSKCAAPYKTETLDVTLGSGGANANGTEEVYAQDGSALDYKTFTVTYAGSAAGKPASIVVQRSIAPAPSASPYASNGYACVLATSASGAVACGSGNVVALPSVAPSPLSIGFTGTTAATFATPSPAPSATAAPGGVFPIGATPAQVQLQIAGAGYSGPLDGLTLAPATLPAWTIAGGKQVASLSGSATFGFGGYGSNVDAGSAIVSSVSLTLTDSADGLTAVLSSSGRTLTGTLANAAGQTVATITLDLSGSGTIAYNDGTTGTIKDWIILG